MKEAVGTLAAKRQTAVEPPISPEEVERVKKKLLEESGLDFSEYRDRHLVRGIARHMKSKGISDMDSYLAWLEANSSDYEDLVEALTVKYTMFFRNPELFDVVYRKVLPRLAERNTDASSRVIRAWSAGCASGEEAYSMAILFSKFMEKRKELDAAVIGTDIDLGNLERARRGSFPSDCMETVRSHAKTLYFSERGGEYRVVPQIRRMVRFKLHDLVTDPPLMGMDLIFCRNVLIYFNESLQERIIQKFYDSLEDGGVLVLGKVEGLLGEAGHRFERLDRREQIFLRKP